jgi:Ca2+-binding RTX toxin-like protein
MPALPLPGPNRNPPIEYAVAVWLGMPDEAVARGLREGWIRAPQAAPAAHDAATPAEGAEAGTTNVGVVNRERIHALVRRLDDSLDSAAFDTAWTLSGGDEATRVERFTRILGAALGIEDASAASFTALESAAGHASGTARLVTLAGRSGGELEALARGDASVRRALAQHLPWTLAGDRALAHVADPRGAYDRFDRDSGEALLSDGWIADRARHAAWRSARDAGRPLGVAGDGWRFVDRRDGDADVELTGSTGVVNQVIFAGDDGDRITGGASTDRLHGGRGDDVLTGRGGEDLLEGGRGDDVLYGGAGRDDLDGQQGHDELDGGAGADRLAGGSGDDDLTGGRGDDLLRGGAGHDRYRFDAGDGNDVVEDADGGELVFDDVRIAGDMRREGDGWVSEDGRLAFTLDGSLHEGGTLTIRHGGDDTASSVTINGWRQQAFGFSLHGDDEGGNAAERDARHAESTSDGLVTEGSPTLAPGETEMVDVVDIDDAPAGGADSASAVDGLADMAASDASAGLVDARAVAAALDGWSVPMPPDIGAAQLVDAHAVTSSMLADALAGDGAGFDDVDAGAGAMSGLRSMFDVPALLDAPIEPPTVALRSSH